MGSCDIAVVRHVVRPPWFPTGDTLGPARVPDPQRGRGRGWLPGEDGRQSYSEGERYCPAGGGGHVLLE